MGHREQERKQCWSLGDIVGLRVQCKWLGWGRAEQSWAAQYRFPPLISKLPCTVIRSELLFELFPFHVVFSRSMEIRSVGSALAAVIPDAVGRKLTEMFFLARPITQFTWEEVSPAFLIFVPLFSVSSSFLIFPHLVLYLSYTWALLLFTWISCYFRELLVVACLFLFLFLLLLHLLFFPQRSDAARVKTGYLDMRYDLCFLDPTTRIEYQSLG